MFFAYRIVVSIDNNFMISADTDQILIVMIDTFIVTDGRFRVYLCVCLLYTSGTFAVMQPIIDKLDLNANLTERKELDAFYAPYNVPADEMYPNVFFTGDEIEEIGVLQTDIDSYVAQKYAGWIVEGGVEDEWDSFQKKLQDMNVERYIQIYKDAYARYSAE